MEARRAWRSVRAGSEATKADMEVEEGWKGGPVVEMRRGQPFSGTIAILFFTSFLLGSVVLEYPDPDLHDGVLSDGAAVSPRWPPRWRASQHPRGPYLPNGS